VRILILFSAVLFFSQCDPAITLIVKSAHKPNLSVTIYANGNILPGYLHPPEKLVLSIPTTEPHRKYDTTFRYGLGGWSDDHVSSFAQNVDSIVFMSSSGKKVLKNQSDIQEYLLKQRHGFGKSVITIKVK